MASYRLVPSQTWVTLGPVRLSRVSPRYATVWAADQGTPQAPYANCLPPGTRLSAPTRVWDRLVIGAYPCSTPPDDDRDNVWWLEFRLLDAAGGLEPGAIVTGYEDQILEMSLFATALD